MKICNLNINNYKQFKNLELELTYPSGHEKEGQPLDKICIIGQSGTGKTNLLNIIKKSVMDFSKLPPNKYLPFHEFAKEITEDSYISSRFLTKNNLLCETLFTKITSKITSIENIELIDNEKKYFIGTNKLAYSNHKNRAKMTDTDKSLLEGFVKHRLTLVEDGIDYHGVSGFEEKLKSLDEKISTLNKKYNIVSESIKELKSQNFIDRNIININDQSNNSWALIKDRIDDYKEDYFQYINKLTNKLLNDDDYGKDNYKDDVKSWENENENILENISLKLNSILNKFNLTLAKIDENQKSYNDLIIKDLSNDSIIKYDDLSTGTKNLLSTFIPLKIYKPKDSMILIDEPEISFYPDIQTQLTELYSEIGINNQLIIATHSPLIASSFEPWEIVELKFNEDNQIYRDLYYTGDNHIDNYILDPRMLTWTSILTDIFNLKEDSNVAVREKKLIEYGMLKSEIKAMKNGEDRRDKIKKFKKLSALLGLPN